MNPGELREKLVGALPFAVLFLPLAGFIVLALLGDRIRRRKEELAAAGSPVPRC